MADVIAAIDEALDQLSQPAMGDNELFDVEWANDDYVTFRHHMANGSEFSIEIFDNSIVVNADSPEAYEAGPKQIERDRNQVVEDLRRLLSYRIEVIQKGNGTELRFLDPDGEPFFRNRYYGSRTSVEGTVFGPVVAPNRNPGIAGT